MDVLEDKKKLIHECNGFVIVKNNNSFLDCGICAAGGAAKQTPARRSLSSAHPGQRRARFKQMHPLQLLEKRSSEYKQYDISYSHSG